MNKPDHNPEIEADLEARIVALVLGEASDLECDQLNRLIEDRPELAALKLQFEQIHGLMCEVGTGDFAEHEDDWKLPEDRRKEVLSVISGEEKAPSSTSALNTQPVALPPAVDQQEIGQAAIEPAAIGQAASSKRFAWRHASIAATLCCVGLFGLVSSLLLRQTAELSATSSVALSRKELRRSASVETESAIPSSSIQLNRSLSENRLERDWYSASDQHERTAGLSEFNSPESPGPDEYVANEHLGESKSALLALGKTLGDRFLGQAEKNNKSLPTPYYLYNDVQYFDSKPSSQTQANAPMAGVDLGVQLNGEVASNDDALGSKFSASGGRPSKEEQSSEALDFALSDVTVPEGGSILLGGIKLYRDHGRRVSPSTGSTAAEAWNRLTPRIIIDEAEEEGFDVAQLSDLSTPSREYEKPPAQNVPSLALPAQSASEAVSGLELPLEDAPVAESLAYEGRRSEWKDKLSFEAPKVAIADGGLNQERELYRSQTFGDVWLERFGAVPLAGESEPETSDREDYMYGFRSDGEGVARGGMGGGGMGGGGMGGMSGAMRGQLAQDFNSPNARGRTLGAPLVAAVEAAPSSTGGTPFSSFHDAPSGLGIADQTLKKKKESAVELQASVEAGTLELGELELPGLSAYQKAAGEQDQYSGKAETQNGRQYDGSWMYREITKNFSETPSVRRELKSKRFSSSGKAFQADAQAGEQLAPGFFGNWSGAVVSGGTEATVDAAGAKRRFQAPIPAFGGVVDFNENSAIEEPFSTFSLHVSDVSFKLAQASLAQGKWPETSKVRIEEFVNAFDYGDPLPSRGEKVACRAEQSIHPFLQQRNILRVSMRTGAAGRANNSPLRLILLLDNSGSMERIDRQQTVRRAFALLAQQLKPIDQVTLISFARQPRLLADKVSGDNTAELTKLIDELPSEGGTNMEAALQLAFEKALEQQAGGDAQNRIILLTDGAVNLGDASPNSLSKLITTIRDSGIAFDAAGISADGLNDEILEALTRKGDGRYYLLDSEESADNGFAKQIAGALRPSAKNVKVQIEFNPERVGQYKLLGFEKHVLKKEDFRNDKVDAAEMAAAEAGVAVYQFEAKPDGEGDVGSVSVRFRDLSTGQMIENRWPIPYEADAPRIDQAAPSLRIATSAALLAAKLKGEPIGQSVDLKTLAELLSSLPTQVLNSQRVEQLRTMIQQAREISGN